VFDSVLPLGKQGRVEGEKRQPCEALVVSQKIQPFKQDSFANETILQERQRLDRDNPLREATLNERQTAHQAVMRETICQHRLGWGRDGGMFAVLLACRSPAFGKG